MDGWMGGWVDGARWCVTELISLTLKMEAICSSETLVDTQPTTLVYIPEDGTLQVKEGLACIN
jgi:hypothetical protein